MLRSKYIYISTYWHTIAPTMFANTKNYNLLWIIIIKYNWLLVRVYHHVVKEEHSQKYVKDITLGKIIFGNIEFIIIHKL